MQRGLRRRGKLRPERIDRLNALAFSWAPYDFAWEEMFERMAAFEREHGHCNVPAKYERDPQLGAWVTHQRVLKRRGKLSHERFARLDASRFIWDPIEARWEEMSDQLVAFKREHGHCNVPAKYERDPQLGAWVTHQRVLKRRGKLSHERFARLDALGFNWDPYGSAWEEIFDQLVAYKAKHGDCNVPRGYGPDPQLGTWVQNQRQIRRKGKLSQQQFDRLDALGFIWDPRKARWHEMLERLVAYKAGHGDCNVPQCYEPDPQLGSWVHNQRQFRRKGKLSQQPIDRLNALGFYWGKRG